MKKLLLTVVATLAATAASYGQGSLVFNNLVPGEVDAPVTYGSADGPGVGPEFSAQLYLVGSGGSLTAIPSSLTTFYAPGTGAAAARSKYIIPPSNVTIDGVAPGASATVRFVVWKTSAGATYEEAFDANPILTGVGGSDVTLTLGGGLTPPPNLIGLEGFTIVPEPTTLALGALGAAALLFRRRK